MATAKELLRSGTIDDTIIIDSDLRTLDIPSSIELLGVESDKDVKRLKFKMPAAYSGIDLSDFDIRINYLNAKSQGDIYPVTDKAVADGYITFSWLIGGFALKYKGSVKFIVCLRKLDSDGVVLKEFNTTPAKLPVLEGLETEARIIQENPSVIESILLRLDALEESDSGGDGLMIDEEVTGHTNRGLVVGQKGSKWVEVITLGNGLKLNGSKLELDIPVYSGEVVELIKFTINIDAIRDYVAISGMTWSEWITSEYNTDGYKVNADGIVCDKNGAAITFNSIEVKSSDIIVSDGFYDYTGG